MICPKCGAEIRLGSKFCEYCGTQITPEMQKQQEQMNKPGCPRCGSTNVRFDREKQGEVKIVYGNAVIRATVGLCKDCGYTWKVSRNKKALSGDDQAVAGKTATDKTWLWVLGWIFIFPVPVTILMLRKKEMAAWKKYGIIAAAWIAYFSIFGSLGV